MILQVNQLKQKQKEEMADVQDFIGKIRQLSQEKETIIQSLEVEKESLRGTIVQLKFEKERELEAARKRLEEMEQSTEKQVKGG